MASITNTAFLQHPLASDLAAGRIGMNGDGRRRTQLWWKTLYQEMDAQKENALCVRSSVHQSFRVSFLFG